MIGADGRGPRRVWPARRQSEDDAIEVEFPSSASWSPDGRVIAFVRGSIVDPYNGAVWAIRPNGTGLRVLTPTLPNCRRCFKNLYFDDIAWQPLHRAADVAVP